MCCHGNVSILPKAHGVQLVLVISLKQFSQQIRYRVEFMAHYRASESKRENFRRYLEKSGALDTLTNVLVTLYEETEKPDNALAFIKRNLGAPDAVNVDDLRAELSQLQQKYDSLTRENEELKNKILQQEQLSVEGEGK